MENPVVYACYNKNMNERLNSSSGGIFSLIASYIINSGGIVYGVAMSEDCYSAEFVAVSEVSLLYKIVGSKYIQAKIGNTYKLVEQELLSGKKVLFSGTGCQINGLKLYLGKDYSNLICMDVVCHGVPSKKIWEKYAKYREDKIGQKIEYVNFRSKENGWKNFGLKQNENYVPKHEDEYMQMFLKNYSLRPSCYNCIAKTKKMSDFSLADFWGIEEIDPDMNDGLGCSLFFVRSSRGKNIFKQIEEYLDYKIVSYDEVVKYNIAEYCSVKRPLERDSFYQDLDKMSFNEFKKKYTDVGRSMIYKLSKRVLNKISKLFVCGGGRQKE